MTPVPKSTPKDVFLHLLAIVALYVSAVSFMTLMFQLISTWFPDSLSYNYGVAEAIRWSASLLIVMFPVFLGITWLINKDFVQHPERREIRVRKWLGYLTLFISALTVIVDLATLVYNLLGGELTVRFILKVLTVLIVAGLIFVYYYLDMKKKSEVTA
jgi:hypothetical protein